MYYPRKIKVYQAPLQMFVHTNHFFGSVAMKNSSVTKERSFEIQSFINDVSNAGFAAKATKVMLTKLESIIRKYVPWTLKNDLKIRHWMNYNYVLII